MNKARGSAVLMCLILMVAMTTVILAECDLTTAGLRCETQTEKRRAADYAFDGAAAQIVDDYFNDALTLPSTRQVAIGDATCNLTITDNSAVLPRTLDISGQVSVKNMQFSISRIVGAHHPPSVFFYALAVSDSATSDQTIVTGNSGAHGDVFFGGNVALSAVGNVVNGDLESGGSITAPSTTVAGSVLPNAAPVQFPSADGRNYAAAADATFTDAALNGYSFAGGGSYPLVYCPGDLSIQGRFSGKGTVYVAGNVEVSGDMTYADASSELVVIAGGEVLFSSNCSNAVGYFFTPQVVQISGSLTIARGAIATNEVEWGGALRIAGDPDVWNNRAEGNNLKLPGMWP